MFGGRRFERGGWAGGGVLAFAVHAAVIGAVLFRIGADRASSVPPAMPVIELAALPLAAAASVPEVSPTPRVSLSSESPRHPLRKRHQPIAASPPSIAGAGPIELAAQERRAQSQAPVADTVPDPIPVAARQGQNPLLVTPVVDVAASTAAADAQATWENQILALLDRNKRYPRGSRARREEDVVYVRFSVNRRGEVLSAAVDRSKGFALLDREGLELLRRASPLPPPPAEVQGSEVELIVPVQFHLVEAQL